MNPNFLDRLLEGRELYNAVARVSEPWTMLAVSTPFKSFKSAVIEFSDRPHPEPAISSSVNNQFLLVGDRLICLQNRVAEHRVGCAAYSMLESHSGVTLARTDNCFCLSKFAHGVLLITRHISRGCTTRWPLRQPVMRNKAISVKTTRNWSEW
jgi:hypothetical protein